MGHASRFFGGRWECEDRSMTELQAEQTPKRRNTSRKPFFGRWAVVATAALCGVLAIGAVLAWRTNDVMGSQPLLKQAGRTGTLGAGQKTLVDETPWKTAELLTAMAVTQEEQEYARQAERLADHEVDQAFATALREADLQRRNLTGAAAATQATVKQLEGMVASDQAALNSAVKGSDAEQLAQAQLGLDQDQLSDEKGELARESGDRSDEIQQELTAREAGMKMFDATGSTRGTGQVASIAMQKYRTLAGLLGAWRGQRQRYQLLLEAKAAAESEAAALSVKHSEAKAKLDQRYGGAGAVVADRVAELNRMSVERQIMSLYNDRIETEGHLADVYGKWAAQVLLQHRIVVHLILIQGMIIVVLIIVAILLDAVVERLSEHESLDRRRMRTLSRITRLIVQVAAVVAILLVVLGPPDHVSTVFGLVTAGLTVALQDFILAFVGWFILMGRAGIGVGDAVEINGVAGEVVDIGLFRTTLLETGNWTAKGHPTGRRVTFNNMYAINGQYFNFSTTGQWMWDEITVSVPTGEDAVATMERVRKIVEAETADDVKTAEAEWQKVSKQQGLSQFSAKPDVNLQPTGTGVNLVVRYVTRATGRIERRNTLYQSLLESLHTPKAEA